MPQAVMTDDLRAAVEALADEWQAKADEGSSRDEPVTRFVHMANAAVRLRALLAPDAPDTAERPPYDCDPEVCNCFTEPR